MDAIVPGSMFLRVPLTLMMKADLVLGQNPKWLCVSKGPWLSPTPHHLSPALRLCAAPSAWSSATTHR